MKKVCNRCNRELPIALFNKHSSTADKRQNQCRPCRNEVQRAYRETKAGASKTTAYEKTKKGFLVRCYRNMLSRINGIQKKKHHLYKGLELLDKETFYNYSLSNAAFNNLFEIWEMNKYKRKITPSIDRIDSSRGYCLDNIRWITFSENSLLGNASKIKKYNTKSG